MGSVDKAVITGFICRLCSRMNRFVVHIYGEEGERLQLAHKINFYLPVNVSPHDPLPKTVCLQCIESLEAQHELMEQIKQARQRFIQAHQEQNQQNPGSSGRKGQVEGQSSRNETQVQSSLLENDSRENEGSSTE